MFCRLLILIIVGSLALVAQADTVPPQQAYELRGSEVPYYYSVRSFLTYGYEVLGRDNAAWERLLDGVGIRPGSSSEGELRTAVLLAAEVWSRKPQISADPTNDPERFDEEQLQWRVDQRRGLAPIFRQLRKVITEEYGSTTNLDAFIAERITPGLSLGSTEPFGEEELTLNGEFDAIMVKEDDQ